jgi:hypothetical protein
MNIDKLTEIAEAATPGPWELRNKSGMQGLIYPKCEHFPVAAATGFYSQNSENTAVYIVTFNPDRVRLMLAVVKAAKEALPLCEWIAESPHVRGSINGKAAQVDYAIRTALNALEAAP